MEFEIVDEIPAPQVRRANARKVFEVAMQHPGKWVKWPTQFSNNAGASSRASELRGHDRYADMRQGCQIVARGQNVYIQYQG